MKKEVHDYDELFPGRFLHAGELQGKEVTLTIAESYLEEPDKVNKLDEPIAVVGFKGTPKEWSLNKTNAQCLKAMFGRATQDWIGHKVTLVGEMVEAFGEKVLAIRVAGSPELSAPLKVTIKLAKKRDYVRTMKVTGSKTAPEAILAPVEGTEFDESTIGAPVAWPGEEPPNDAA